MWFVAAIVPGRPRIWLYKSLWLLSSNKYGGFARIYYASCPVLLLPSYRALDYGTLLSSLSFSQSPIVSMCVCVCVCVCVFISILQIFLASVLFLNDTESWQKSHLVCWLCMRQFNLISVTYILLFCFHGGYISYIDY